MTFRRLNFPRQSKDLFELNADGSKIMTKKRKKTNVSRRTKRWTMLLCNNSSSCSTHSSLNFDSSDTELILFIIVEENRKKAVETFRWMNERTLFYDNNRSGSTWINTVFSQGTPSRCHSARTEQWHRNRQVCIQLVSNRATLGSGRYIFPTSWHLERVHRTVQRDCLESVSASSTPTSQLNILASESKTLLAQRLTIEFET